MPHVLSATMRVGPAWLNSPRAIPACSIGRCFAAANAMANACSAIDSACAPALLARGTCGGS